MTDIVERLRYRPVDIDEPFYPLDLCKEAAAEIERLTSGDLCKSLYVENIALRVENAKLREALEQIASYGPGSQAPLIARAALQKDQGEDG